VERRGSVAGERDQADVGMVSAQSRRGSDAVEEWHVEIDHDGVGVEELRQLDRPQTVVRLADDRELWLPVDQVSKRFEKRAIVIGD